MCVVSDHEIRICRYCAIRELVVVWVVGNDLKPISGLHLEQKVADHFGQRKDFP